MTQDFEGPAYLIHSKPYQENHAWVRLWTQDHGMISAIARGVQSTRSRQRFALQPFARLNVHIQGRRSLKTLLRSETLYTWPLQGEILPCGLYLNELMYRSQMMDEEPHPPLWEAYEQVLAQLIKRDVWSSLRTFEYQILNLLGYGFIEDVVPEAWYQLCPQKGLICVSEQALEERQALPGHVWLALKRGELQEEEARSLKPFMQKALAYFLRIETIHARAFFQIT